MDEWRDFFVVTKGNVAIKLRAKEMVINDGKYVTVYDDTGIMSIIPLDEVKALFFGDVSDDLILSFTEG